MSLWKAVSTAWRVGTTYRNAYESARDAVLAGKSISEAVDIFASLTPGEFDDKLADELKRGLELSIGYAQQGALALGRIAATIEAKAPEALAAVRRLSTRAHQLTARIEALSGNALTHADRVREIAARAGVLAARLAIRLDKLRGSR